jgi:hypothetical protein
MRMAMADMGQPEPTVAALLTELDQEDEEEEG